MSAKWTLPAEKPEAAERLARDLRIARLTARLLLNRGLSDAGSAGRFLEPSLKELKDPRENPTLTEAAGFLWDSVRAGRRITVFGDYDADGICATALLVRCLRSAGAEVDFHIPHRIEDGYGLTCEALQAHRDRGAEVAVTVDCGISSCREAEHAAAIGLDLVVTDHHKPGHARPAARHVLNPLLPDCAFGYERLAGVGVAFKLAWAFGQAMSARPSVPDEYKPVLVDALPLVALGTVADMAPLVDENRVLVSYGLRAIPQTANPGLRALMESAEGTGNGGISAYRVAYHLAPRLNAVGRMGHAGVAVEMLLTDDPRHAADLAAHHNQQNRLRQNVQKAIFEEAQARAAAEFDAEHCGCIVLASPDWHLGVVGPVASRLSETFWRPAFVLRKENDMARGSARSIPGFPLFEAIRRCEDLVERFGGHEGAAGLTLPVANLEPFTDRINDIAIELQGSPPPGPELALEGEVNLRELSDDAVRELRRLAPFGMGNPQPLFMAGALSVAGNPQLVGKGRKHLSFLARQNGVSLRVIAFGKADWLPLLNARRGEPFALAFEPMLNGFRGPERVELRAEDIQWHSELRTERSA